MKSKGKKTIAYYITAHGFGHAVRSLEIIRRLIENNKDLEVILVSDLPPFLVEENAGRPLITRRKKLDVGLVQTDSLQFDLEATWEALEHLRIHEKAIVAEEIDFLAKQRVDGVVCDIPFLPFRAASRRGIPSVGISNFTWDWIYQAYARTDSRWRSLVSWIQEGYRHCDLFLQLPMHGDCSACPHVHDVPLVARKATRKPEHTREILGCDPQEKAYLISFADLPLSAEAQRRLEGIEGAVFFFKRPLKYAFANGRSLDRFDLSYADVVAAMDGVITKPGYGIVSDCLVHGTPIIFTDRGFFPEYEILVEEMERHLTTVYMPSQELYSGSWEGSIKRLESLPRRSSRLRDDGASVCAGKIMNLLEGTASG